MGQKRGSHPTRLNGAVMSNVGYRPRPSTILGCRCREGYHQIATRPKADGSEVRVKCLRADEWYTVDGSPIE